MLRPPFSALDLITIGRSGVDIYPLQTGIGLEDVSSFGKFLGGSPTNVAVAAARLGNRCATITAVGTDPFGHFVRREMRRLGVSDRYVVDVSGARTPVTFCEIFPPDTFPLYFYRDKHSPDMQLTPSDIPISLLPQVGVFWLAATSLLTQSSRDAHMAALDARGSEGWTVLDLDYRASFWDSEESAHAEVERVLPRVNVAIGNIEECRIAVGETDPDRAADALLERGIEIAVVKSGPQGALAKTREERVVIPPTTVEVCNGLGAGDAFGGSFCHALLCGWDLPHILQFSSTAGAIVASRLECSTSMPTEFEIEHLIEKNPQVFPSVQRPARP